MNPHFLWTYPPRPSALGYYRPAFWRPIYLRLLGEYPPALLRWVPTARWTYNPRIPLHQIRYGRRPGSRNLREVDQMTAALQAGDSLPPVILVHEGGTGRMARFRIADGYHRVLAYAHARYLTLPAFVAFGLPAHGPWEAAMHHAKYHSDWNQLHKALGRLAALRRAFHTLQKGSTSDEIDPYSGRRRVKWVTIGGVRKGKHKHVGGRRVLVDMRGRVLLGQVPKFLLNKPVDNIAAWREFNQAKQRERQRQLAKRPAARKRAARQAQRKKERDLS